MRSTITSTLAVLLCAVSLAACGDSAAEEREALRTEAEREFGRPEAGEDEPDGADDEATAASDAIDPADAASGVSAETDPGAAADLPNPDAGEDPAAGAEAGPPEAEDPPVTASPAGQEPDAASLLADADRAYSGLASLRAEFVQRVDLPLVDRTAQGYGVWYQEGRDRFRMDFVDPPDDVFVADGEFLWLYQPSATPGQVIKSELAAGGTGAGGADVLARILSEARASYDASYEGTAVVSSERTHVISLVPRGPSEYRSVRVWIADSDRLVRRFRIEEENEMIRTVTLAALEPNVALDDGLFAFTPPPGVETFVP